MARVITPEQRSRWNAKRRERRDLERAKAKGELLRAITANREEIIKAFRETNFPMVVARYREGVPRRTAEGMIFPVIRDAIRNNEA